MDDLEEAKTFAKGLGLALTRELTLPGRLKAAFFRCGDAEIEMVEVTEPNERQRRLGTSKARLEHIALEVEGLSDVVSQLNRLGVTMTSSAAFQLGNVSSYWTEPDSSDGVMYQLMERS